MSNGVEQWQQQRLEKLQHIEPPQQRGLEKRLFQVEEIIEEKKFPNYKGFYPQFGTISTGSGLAAGITYWKPGLGDSVLDLQVSADYSLQEYQRYDVQFGKIPQDQVEFFLRGGRSGSTSQFNKLSRKDREFFLYADLRYRDFPQEDFFGIGPQSEKEDQTDFELEDASYDGVVGYQFNRWLRADFRAGFLQVDIKPGRDSDFPNTQKLFDDTSAPGLTEQPGFFRLSSSILLDYRDKPGNPHVGGIVGFSVTRYDDRDDSDFDFYRFAVNARNYLPLGSPARILAVQFFTSLDDTDNTSRVPFYFQETLGGGDTLRGFKNFRFRDTNVVYLSAEYRWEASQLLEFALFYDTGKVFADRADFDLDGLEDSYGFGVRIKTPNSTVFRVDLGHSDEGTQIYFKFGSSF